MEAEQHDTKLQRLAVYLHRLPSSLPINLFSHYNFQDFSLDPEWIEIIGMVEGAVNRELETWLGMHADGPIEFVEWGPVVENLVNVLNHYLLHMAAPLLLTHTFPVRWRRPLKRKLRCCRKSRTWLSHMMVAQQRQWNQSILFMLPHHELSRPTWLKAMKHQVCCTLGPKLPMSFSRLVLCLLHDCLSH